MKQHGHAISHEFLASLLPPNPLILELGCNNGADTERLLDAMPTAEIHCFEPDPRPLKRFRSICDSRITVYCEAIAGHNGTASLHLSGGRRPGVGRGWGPWDKSSSIREPKLHRTRYPWCTFDDTITVPCRTLDEWHRRDGRGRTIDLIWADIQGAEIDLIQGGRETLLKYTRYLYTEFSDLPLYKGQIGLAQIMAALPAFRCENLYLDNALLENVEL